MNDQYIEPEETIQNRSRSAEFVPIHIERIREDLQILASSHDTLTEQVELTNIKLDRMNDLLESIDHYLYRMPPKTTRLPWQFYFLVSGIAAGLFLNLFF